MKNKLTLLSFALASILTLTFNNISGQTCKAKQISNSVKKHIKAPFMYDGYVLNDYTFDSDQLIEVQFVAFRGMKYKLVFCSSTFDEEIKVNVYDKPKSSSSRAKVFDDSQGIENNYWVFEPEKSGKYFIEYQISKSKTDPKKQGCIVMVLGFLDEGGE